MSGIRDTMVDTSFVEEVAAYLRKEHGVRAWVVDGDESFVPLGGMESVDLPHVKSFPFGSGNGFGGLRCAAESESALLRAEPHILLGVKGIGHLLARDTELMQTSDEMLQLSGQMSILFNLARKTLGVNEIDEFCRIVLEEIAPAIRADYGIVHTKGRGDQEIDIPCNVGRDEIAGLHAKVRTAIPVKDATVISSLPDGTSVLCCPIKEKDGPIGFMAFFKSPEKRFFTSYEKKFVSIIEQTISPTVETLRLYGSLQDLYINTVKALAAAIDAKDRYTHGHSFRVARFSNAIGRNLGIPEKQLNDLDIAAYMHDLGKIGVPESILGKPGKLTEEEFLEIKRHPLLTNKILEPIHLPSMIVDAAVQHHERVDGKGYPFGLKGDQISLFGRIIAVADVFDALTSNRPYRDAMTVEKALVILCEDIDKAFDHKAVQAFVHALQSGETEREWLESMPDLRFTDLRSLDRFLVDLHKILHRSGTAEAPRETPGKEMAHA